MLMKKLINRGCSVGQGDTQIYDVLKEIYKRKVSKCFIFLHLTVIKNGSND